MVIANYIVDLVSVSKDLYKIIRMQQFKAYYNKFIESEKFIEYQLFITKHNCNNYKILIQLERTINNKY